MEKEKKRRKIFEVPNLRNENEDYLKVIDSEWYSLILKICDEINYSTHIFYRDLGIKSVFLPITTGAISSPMGLSSDSLPVGVEIAGIKTYLADSMQFLLEYSCRLADKGNPYDNALVESFFKTFKREVLSKRYYKTKSEAKMEVLNYVEVYYNKKRCLSSLGYMTPNEFDLQNS